MTDIRITPVRNADRTWQASVLVIENNRLLYAFRTAILRLTEEDARSDGEAERNDLLMSNV